MITMVSDIASAEAQDAGCWYLYMVLGFVLGAVGGFCLARLFETVLLAV